MLVSKKPTPSLVDPTPSLADPTPSLVDPMQASGIEFLLGWDCVVYSCFFCVGYPTRTLFPVEYGLISVQDNKIPVRSLVMHDPMALRRLPKF